MSNNLNGNQKIAIVDGGLIFKWFYAIPNMKNPKGAPIGAVYGFIKMLVGLMNEGYQRIIVALDSGGDTMRHDIYPNYKSNRASVPEDLKSQFSIFKSALDALGIFYIAKEGFEADDIIASFVSLYYRHNFNVHIVSSDKDLTQLVNNRVVVYDPSKKLIMGKNEVMMKFGVYPEYILDYISLLGDAVDVIPGVKGIGKKTAVDLIEKFGHLEDIYNQIEKVQPTRVQKYLIENKEMAFVSRTLATLHIIADLSEVDMVPPITPSIEKINEFNNEHSFGFLDNFCTKLGTKINENQKTIEDQCSLF